MISNVAKLRRLSAAAVLLGLVMLAAGCSEQLVREEGAELKDQTRSGDEAPAQSAKLTPPPPAPKPPREVSDALLPSMDAGADAEPRFDIDVQDAEARVFFNSLVRGSDHNMVVHPDVGGSVSLTLKDVSVPEVMRLMQRVYGYEYEQTETGYLVLPARMQSRTFYVNYPDLQRQGASQTRVSSGELRQGDDDNDSGGDGGGPVVLGGDDEQQASGFGSNVSTSTQSSFWQTLSESLRAIVGDAEGRSVVINPNSGLVVVRALTSELRDVEDYLTRIQSSMHRQVILEAKIVEITLADGFESGINWARLLEDDGDAAVIGQSTSGAFDDSTSPFRPTDLLNDARTDFDPFNATGLSENAFGGAFAASLRIGDFAAFIELLDTQGDVQVLSSPRVATVNNQKAIIKVGSDEFFVTDISTTTVASTATATTPDITLTPFFSGIALDVTPQISDGGEVILHIHPTVSDVVDQRKEISVGGQTQSLPLALSTVREADSIIRASHGQIVVIGGLMQEQRRDRRAGVPVLGSLPLVGGLFRHTRQSVEKTELVIMLRPLISSTEQPRDGLDGYSDRVRNLSGYP